MKAEIVDMDGKRPPDSATSARRDAGHPVSDFWFAQVDLRLTRIETMMERVERQIWMMVYAAGGVLLIEGLRALIAV
ncbi:hypothetical protein [Aestuariibius sp. HNIBRBA575]|uniref:GTA head formation protein, RCAP_rcc01685 family n=1 Tax=Aestuariibius sp. HNIBRBA575 TaxID=3233343 RepID=UPI0034A40EA7